jgi:hypothetical protein
MIHAQNNVSQVKRNAMEVGFSAALPGNSQTGRRRGQKNN